MIGDSHILNLVNPATGSAGATSGTFTVPFTRNRNYDFFTQTGDILLNPDLTNATEGIVVQYCIDGSASYVVNFDVKVIDGNGIQFDSTKRNYITIVFSQGQFLRYITKVSIPISGIFLVKNINSITATSAVFSVSTSVGATVKWMITTSATVPSKADILAGTGAVVFGSQITAANVVSNVPLSGLTASVNYYLYCYGIDALSVETAIQPTIIFATASASFTTKSLSVLASNQVPSVASAPKFSAVSAGANVDFTIAFDVKIVATGTKQYICQYVAGNQSVEQYDVAIDATGNIIFLISTNYSNYKYIQSNSSLTPGIWYRVVLEFIASSATQNAYVNNGNHSTTSSATGTFTVVPYDTTFVFYAGGFPASNLLIDNFLMFNRILTASEKTELYNMGTPKDPALLTFAGSRIVDYRFENNLLDSSANAYSLTSVAAPTYSPDHI